MKPAEQLVRVTAREGANLEALAGASGPISAACGTAGPSIARQVISGNGAAEVPLSVIQMATDTQAGVEAIFDNFVLSDPRTAAPLVHFLASMYSGSK
jgi:hypothetical protein